MPDDDTRDAVLDGLSDGLSQDDILFGTHVLAEDAEKFLSLEITDFGQFGNRAIEFPRREGRDDRAGALTWLKCALIL